MSSCASEGGGSVIRKGIAAATARRKPQPDGAPRPASSLIEASAHRINFINSHDKRFIQAIVETTERFFPFAEPPADIGVCVEALKVRGPTVRGIPRRFEDCSWRLCRPRDAVCFDRCCIRPSHALGAIDANR